MHHRWGIFNFPTMALYAFIVALILGASYFGYEEWKKKETEQSKIAPPQDKSDSLASSIKQVN